ncbi:hypothetical protein JTE90_000117 [Oedothorax gibbosus]|uniref:Uncharacterized protein n=1 Tax=Oedothorax gibbosus TaxID=931172 RepID=A0AAV6V315_9ARAC|nr:hypothetical protein JTE90_000117 [Oedothorax gibbosus]
MYTNINDITPVTNSIFIDKQNIFAPNGPRHIFFLDKNSMWPSKSKLLDSSPCVIGYQNNDLQFAWSLRNVSTTDADLRGLIELLRV